MSEIAIEVSPLLLRLSAVETFPDKASHMKASALGGAKPNQAKEAEALILGKPSNSLQKDLQEKAPEEQGLGARVD